MLNKNVEQKILISSFRNVGKKGIGRAGSRYDLFFLAAFGTAAYMIPDVSNSAPPEAGTFFFNIFVQHFLFNILFNIMFNIFVQQNIASLRKQPNVARQRCHHLHCFLEQRRTIFFCSSYFVQQSSCDRLRRHASVFRTHRARSHFEPIRVAEVWRCRPPEAQDKFG